MRTNKLQTALIIFGWSLLFDLLLGGLSLFYRDAFLGTWLLSPRYYPLSYSIFLAASFAGGAILSWAFGQIKNYVELSFILLGIFMGSVINIFLVILGGIHLYSSICDVISLIILLIPLLIIRQDISGVALSIIELFLKSMEKIISKVVLSGELLRFT